MHYYKGKFKKNKDNDQDSSKLLSNDNYSSEIP